MWKRSKRIARDEKLSNCSYKLPYWLSCKIDMVEKEWVTQLKKLRDLANMIGDVKKRMRNSSIN